MADAIRAYNRMMDQSQRCVSAERTLRLVELQRETLLEVLSDFPTPPKGNPNMTPEWWDEQLQDFWEAVVDWNENRRRGTLLAIQP